MKDKLLKRVLSVALSVLMIGSTLVCIPALTNNSSIVVNATGATVTDSGECGVDGDNVTYTLDADGTLTISGSGNMREYDYQSSPFYGNSNIKKIIIENGVTSIGSDAFRFCSNLISIIIPDSVTSIGSFAFFNCSNLTNIIIPDGLTYVGRNALWGTAWYNNLPEGLVYVGKVMYVYKGVMPENTSINIKDGTVYIGDSAFDGCSGLISIKIPNSVTSIGSFAFYDCSRLMSITIPNSLTTINDRTFYGCSNLTSITIPDSVYFIDTYNAFIGCSSLSSINVGSNNINYSSVDGILYDKNKTTILFCPPSKTIVNNIPNSVTSIGFMTFSGCNSLVSITIPDSVTSIDSYAFESCSNLSSITIPDSVTSIGGDAFRSCSNLSSITIPDSVTSIGDNAFSDTAWYDNQPDGIVYVGKVLYKYKGTMPYKTSLTIPYGVKSISDCAFEECNCLTSITIPESVTFIGAMAFKGCNSLMSITIPNSVTNLNVFGIFYNCSSLTNITIPNNVTSIGYNVFYGCSNLTCIIIPDSVTYIYDDAFGQCNDLTIYGYKDSYAERYAYNNNIEFVAISNLKNTSITNSETLILGKKLTITGAAKNGTAPYTYAYYYKRSTNTKWNKIGTEFGTATSASFKPVAAADYDIKVVVKDADGNTAEKLFKLTVTSALTNTSWVNAEKVQIGDDICVTGGAEGGAGGYTYAYYFKRSVNTKWNKIGTEFGTASYAITIPKAATDYDMKVVVKDSEGNTAEKIFKVTAVESLPLTNISLINTPATISTGKTVTLAGRYVGGTKPVKYEFYFKRSVNTKWNKLSYGNTKGTYAKFTPTAAAQYDLKAVAIDANGTKAEKIITLTAE